MVPAHPSEGDSRERRTEVATGAHAGHHSLAPCRAPAKAQDEEEDGELSALMRGMMNAQANDSGWPTFSGRYVEYPRFHKEWWAYRQTYHGHVRDKLV
jgi:hypothetical protein